MWLIKYRVGITAYHAGPYTFSEAVYQLEDIRGYEGVTDAIMVPLEDE